MFLMHCLVFINWCLIIHFHCIISLIIHLHIESLTVNFDVVDDIDVGAIDVLKCALL